MSDLDELIEQCAKHDERLALIFIDWWQNGPPVPERATSVEAALDDFVTLMARFEAEGYRIAKVMP